MPKKRTSLDALALSDTPATEHPTEIKSQSKETKTSGTTRNHTSLAYCVPVIEDIAEEAGAIDSKGEYLKHLEKFILSARKGQK